jgi:hypothetical protein
MTPNRAPASFRPTTTQAMAPVNADWNATMPAELVDLAPAEPFKEALRGLQTREVHEPEVFRLFFG